MASIYEMTEEFKTLWQLMEDGTLEDDALVGAFDVAREDLADKLEGYCKFLKNLESDIAGLKAEEKRLAERRKVMENTRDKAKIAMLGAMKSAGEKKIAAGSFTVSVQANPVKVILDEYDVDNIPEAYLKHPAPEVDRSAIKDALQNGDDQVKLALEGIAHLEQDDGIRIR